MNQSSPPTEAQAGADELIPTRWSLIERLRDWDDQESWREFFDTYWRLIYSLATKAGLSHTEAEDVVQETIVSVCRKISEFKADPKLGSFKSWLLQLTRWRILDQLRKRPPADEARQHRRPDRAPSDPPSTATEERVPDLSPSHLETIWEQEWESNLIEAALERLKPQVGARQFQIFYLHVIKQLPPTEVARGLGVNLGQVYLAKHRMAGLFKKAVKEVEELAGGRG